MKRRFLLDVVIRKRAAVLKLLTGEDQTLLVWWDALLILDLSLNVVYCVASFDVQRDRLTRQSLHEDLHATAEPQHQMKRRFLLDVVIRKRAAVLKLLTGEDQTLLVWWDALLILDLSL